MGREVVRTEITATVSRHNSEQDRLDDEAWEQFQEELDRLIESYEWSRIGIMRF